VAGARRQAPNCGKRWPRTVQNWHPFQVRKSPRYTAEKDREYQLAIEKARQEERGRFFNQPHAGADFEHWSKLAHWTLDEAVALSLGKAPERVNWETVSKYLQLSTFAVQYSRRRELALRAAQWKQLYDPVLPGIFLAWAKRLEIEVPAALVEAVQKRGSNPRLEVLVR
jgi:hypothetical protein